MFQRTGCYGKLESLALSLLRQQTVNQTAGEAVAASHAVDDGIDVVALALVELLAVVYESLPAVVRSGEALTQGAHHILESEFLLHLPEDAFISGSIRLSALNIGIGFKAQTELGILLVADTYVHVLHQRAHHRDSLLARPQFLAEVQIHAHRHTVLLGSDAGLAQTLCRGIGDGGGDTAPVEPVGTLEYLVEIEILGLCLSDGTVCPVVYHL